MKTIAAEAWAEMKGGADLPKIHEKAVARWVSGIAPKASLGPAPGSIYDDEEDDEDDDEVLFGSINPTARDRTALEYEKTNQGLTGVRLLALSLSIELGRVPSPGEVAANLTFKADPRMCELARKQRKAGIATLSKILEEKDNFTRQANYHFGGIVREYSEKGFVIEASRITQFWAEAQSITTDERVRAEYIKEYFKKNPGRGLPDVIDVVLATRVTGSHASNGASAEVVKEIKDLQKSAKGEIAELLRELSNLRSELGRVRSRHPRRRPSGSGGCEGG